MAGRLVWLFAIWCVAAAPARADVRLWQEEPTTVPSDEVRHVDLGLFVQPAYAWWARPAANEQALFVHRARVALDARLFPWATARVSLEAYPYPHLADGYLDLAPLDVLHVRAGRFTLPFSRAMAFDDALEAFPIPREPTELVASWPEALYGVYRARRSPVLFRRDYGVMLHGAFGDVDAGPFLEYGAGAFAGSGLPSFEETDDSHGLALSARVEAHLLGLPLGDEAESDLARNDRPRVSIGAGVRANCDVHRDYVRGLTVDAELRYEGLYVSADFTRLRWGAASESGLPGFLGYDRDCGADDEGAEAVGIFGTVQAQWVLPPLLFPVDGQALELLLRWQWLEPSDPPGGFFGGPDDRDPDAIPNGWRLAFGLTWYPASDPLLRLSASYELRRETEAARLGATEIVDVDDDALWFELTAGL